MKFFLPRRRSTILIPSGPGENQKHLFVLLTDPIGPSEEILLVSLSSVKPSRPNDRTCLLYPGDHPFIQRDTFANYALARIETAGKLTAGVESQTMYPREMMDPGIFARICKGLIDSRFTVPKLKRFYQQSIS